MAVLDAITLDTALLCGDVSAAWTVWSCAVVIALGEAYRSARGPISDKGVGVGSRLRTVAHCSVGGTEASKGLQQRGGSSGWCGCVHVPRLECCSCV